MVDVGVTVNTPSSKRRPFTRRHRAQALKRERIEARKERRERREEQRDFYRDLTGPTGPFKGCSPARTQDLADAFEGSLT